MMTILPKRLINSLSFLLSPLTAAITFVVAPFRSYVAITMMLTLSLLASGCTNNNVKPDTGNDIVLHNQLPKNIRLIDMHIHKLDNGIRIKGNLKYSSIKIRGHRPRGTLFIQMNNANGDLLAKQSLKLRQKGILSNHSHYDFVIDKALPANSHLYFSYLK